MIAFSRMIAAVVVAGSLTTAAPALAKSVMETVRPEPGVHRMGNPAAQVKLVEYVSYTCPHCAHFEQEAGTPLRVIYVGSGKVSLETRHIVRDPVDLTAAMLTNCGPVAKFDRNHAMFMTEQATWLGKLNKATQAQKNRYSTGSFTARRQAIARDAGFYAMMKRRGYESVQVDKCLADESLAGVLATKTAGYIEDKGVTGTPSFAIDGVLLAGTTDWKSLKFQLDLHL